MLTILLTGKLVASPQGTGPFRNRQRFGVAQVQNGLGVDCSQGSTIEQEVQLQSCGADGYPGGLEVVKLRLKSIRSSQVLFENAYAQLRCPMRNHAHIACYAGA